MARSSNPAQEHHRQKHRKEVQKNKQQRLKERDEKVVQTKTVASVKEEIRNLKRRKNLQPSETQKLQRLEKELKLVTAAAANKPKTYQHPERTEPLQLTELDDPRKSVYYDERFNPYGAPPPGKPRLYHKAGGGVTMDVKFAIVPGEEPPQNSTQPPQLPNQPQHSNRNVNDSNVDSRESNQAAWDAPSESLKRKSRSPSPPMHDAAPSDKKTHPGTTSTITTLNTSKKRVRRGKATTDIWASNDEVQYERENNQVDLEADDIGVVAPKPKKKSKKKPPLEFYYKDMSHQVQGPFQKAQMRGWMQAGFFPVSTLVKTSRTEKWSPIMEVQALQEDAPPKPRELSVQDRIAALKGATANEPAVQDDNSPFQQDAPAETSVQDRIAALREENSEAPSIQDRIAALKGEKSEAPCTQERIAALEGEDSEASSIQDRIAALKGEKSEAPSIQDRIAALKGETAVSSVAEEEEIHYEEARVAAHPEDTSAHPAPCPIDNVTAGPAPYPVDENLEAPVTYPVDDGIEGPPLYQLDESAQGPADYPVDGGDGVAPYPANEADEPPPYAVEEDDAAHYPTVSSYPGDEENAVAPYPTADIEEHDAPPRYPVDEDGDVPYPVDAAYPANDPYPATDAYPVTDSYPVTDAYPAEIDAFGHANDDAPAYPIEAEHIAEQSQKTIKVDGQVVAFLPSHLQKKKLKNESQPTREPTTKAVARPREVANVKQTKTDDYDKFMEEIEGL